MVIFVVVMMIFNDTVVVSYCTTLKGRL